MALPCQQPAIVAGQRHLAGMRANGVDARIERRVAALDGVDRHGSGHHRGLHGPFGVDQRMKRDGGRNLRPVQERKTFLGPELHGFQFRQPERRRSAHPAAAEQGFAFADQHQRQMRQRRQIARSAHRALRRDDRDDLGVDEAGEGGGGRRMDARIAARQRLELEHHDEPHGVGRKRFAGPGGVRAHQIDLQRVEIAIGDAGLGELAEAGIDAIDRLAAFHELQHRGMRCCDGPLGVSADAHPARPGECGAHVIERKVGVADQHRAGNHFPSPLRRGVRGGGLVAPARPPPLIPPHKGEGKHSNRVHDEVIRQLISLVIVFLKRVAMARSSRCRRSLTSCSPATNTCFTHALPPENIHEIEQAIAAAADERRMRLIEHHDIGSHCPEQSIPAAGRAPQHLPPVRHHGASGRSSGRDRPPAHCGRDGEGAANIRADGFPPPGSWRYGCRSRAPWRRRPRGTTLPLKMPSPRFASVVGQRPAIAPLRASAAVSASFMCVAWIRHQRADSSNSDISNSTGRLPENATQSSTSLVCSATWICTGAPGRKPIDGCQRAAEHFPGHGAQGMRRDAEPGARIRAEPPCRAAPGWRQTARRR